MNEKRKTWESLSTSFNALGEELLLANEASTIRLDELSSELAVWKRAERQSREELVQLQRSIAEQAGQQERSLIAVILDGDGAIFQPNLLKAGRDGGREAASLLRKGIIEHARKRLGKEPDQIIVHCFANVAGLSIALKDNKIVNEQTFGEFIIGWNTSHPLFSLLDCGKAKEGADAKMREHLKLYASLSTCGVVYAGCSHDGGYATGFGALRTEGLLDKVVLLKSYSDVAHEIKFFDLPTLELPDVFIKTKLVTSWKTFASKPTATASKAGPSSVNKLANGLASTSLDPPGAKISKSSTTTTTKSTSLPTGRGGTVPLDPNIPLHRNKPSPCNRYYLSPESCKKPNCHFGHDYAISPAQLEQLAKDAKLSPCFYAINGQECWEMVKYGSCTMGHECPRGMSCPYGDRCRFSEPGMHPPGYTGKATTYAKGKQYSKSTSIPTVGHKGKKRLIVPQDDWTSSEEEDSDEDSSEEEEIVLKPRA